MKQAIYTPKGKALEYCTNKISGRFAVNLYRGCGHGCVDCYAPLVIRLDRQEFYDNPQPRKGIIERLKIEAKKIGDKYETQRELCFNELARRPERPEVFLCFTTDPYQPINKEHQLTRQAIEIFHTNDIAVNILTKGRITDFDLLGKRPDLSRVGVTLTSTHHATSREWEPEAALPKQRMENLHNAKELGIFTWVSLEPARNLGAVKNIIDYTHDFVDHYKLGKWNYDPRAKEIDWRVFVNEVIESFEKYRCDYYIKDDLKGYI